MKRILISLLVVGFLTGTFIMADVVFEAGTSFQGMDSIGDGGLTENPGGVSPCGQGGTGGPPVPG